MSASTSSAASDGLDRAPIVVRRSPRRPCPRDCRGSRELDRNAARRSRVASENSTTDRFDRPQASTARMPGPPAFVTIATRRPAGSGCGVRHDAMSNISSIVSARITPVDSKSASTTTSAAASAAVWLLAARTPARVRPALTATIGLRPADPARQLAELARVAERLEVEQDDRRRRRRSPRYSRRSLLETSALLPTLTKRREADAAIARPARGSSGRARRSATRAPPGRAAEIPARTTR